MFNCFLQNTAYLIYIWHFTWFSFSVSLLCFFNLSWFNIQFENESAPKHPEAESKQTTEIAKVVGSGALVYPTSSIQDSINVEG